jgi:hypothetical protein
MKAGLAAAWLAGVGLVSWRMVHRDHRMPVPGTLLGISGLFAALALISDVWPASAPLVTVTAVGLDVAAFYEAIPAGLGGQITKAEQSTAKAEGVDVG